MNFNSYILEQALRRLQLSEEAIRQFQLAGKFSDVEGRGFPKELFQLSTPVIIRGLLNFAVLQMQRDWLYPFWVHQQLDPASPSYIPRAQNPLLINVTHRNWTAVGTLNGFHEAVVDPRGLATPLPREWSIDTWLILDDKTFFPSLAPSAEQTMEKTFPCLTTKFEMEGVDLIAEHFAAPTNHGIDVLFAKAQVKNKSGMRKSGAVCVAIRPFNPEGVAPVFSVEFRSPRIAHVNRTAGIAFAESPDGVLCSSLEDGDIANLLKQEAMSSLVGKWKTTSKCDHGLAHAAALFFFDLAPGEQRSVHYSTALAEEKPLLRRGTKQTWRVSYEKRKSDQEAKWEKELSTGATFEFPDGALKALFDASRLTLLQLNDGDFISPGPFIYHHFWYRDAALMIRALDSLGFHKRSRQVIDAFPRRLMSDGFFRGPDGEWDSNGAVIWSVYQHSLISNQHLWLKSWYPFLKRAAQWIVRKRKQTENGLMPPSLSAEHLGTVDQYYWDSFWSLAGMKSMVRVASMLNMDPDVGYFRKEAIAFERDVFTSLNAVNERLGEELIPATERRNFDESAIGSISCLYPLELFESRLRSSVNTLRKIANQFVCEKGFLHPIVHSGYNPYLTLQIAHAFLVVGEIEKAWKIADTIFSQGAPPYSFPEAIHPRSGGGTMGDGHHGWAAAEIVLFLRDCLVNEVDDSITLFKGGANRLVRRGMTTTLQNVPTKFGPVTCALTFTGPTSATIDFEGKFSSGKTPVEVTIYLPFKIISAVASSPNHVSVSSGEDGCAVLHCSPRMRTLFLKL
ncbi:MAG TPA: hypothetical protein VMM58_08785 [Bacteroidota bacterium]|nr:hypothetical protein [Bacteroidota bacterium]